MNWEQSKTELQKQYEALKKRAILPGGLQGIAEEFAGTTSTVQTELRPDLLSTSEFIIKKFEGKTRQDGQTPLVLHSLFLPFILNRFGETSPETLLTALLHDTIEDTATTLGDLKHLRFASTQADISSLVKFLTQDKNISDELPKGSAISPRVQKFMETLTDAPAHVINIELADRIHDFLDLEYMKSLDPKAAEIRLANKKERNRSIVSRIAGGRRDINQDLLEFFWHLCTK